MKREHADTRAGRRHTPRRHLGDEELNLSPHNWGLLKGGGPFTEVGSCPAFEVHSPAQVPANATCSRENLRFREILLMPNPDTLVSTYAATVSGEGVVTKRVHRGSRAGRCHPLSRRDTGHGNVCPLVPARAKSDSPDVHREPTGIRPQGCSLAQVGY